jgi:hydrogenase maturation factor
MALASNLGFRLQESNIEVAKETATICSNLKINPSRLLGSGCLLASIKPDAIDLIIEELWKQNIRGTMIGKFGGERKEIIRNNGSVDEVQSIVVDELWRLLQH